MTKLIVLLIAVVLNQNATLRGVVLDSDDRPVENARVVIANVKPQQELATRGPRDYPECGRHVLTGSDGSFSLDGVAANRAYQLAVAAEGFDGELLKDFVAPSDKVVALRLTKLSAKPEQRLRGQVLNTEGRPVAGAVVTAREVHQAGRMTGRAAGLVCPLTVTDQDGRFELQADRSVTAVTLRIQGVEAAVQDVEWSALEGNDLLVKLERGASIRGRLIHEGRPQPGLRIELVQEDRTLGNVVTPIELHTDAEGVFQFDHIPADLQYAIYSAIHPGAPCALPVHLVDAPGNGKRAELGDVTAETPSTLTIKLINGDEARFPENSILFVGRDKAWQAVRMTLNADPEQVFEISDVGREQFQVFLRVPGFKVLRTVPQQSADINRRYPVLVDGDTQITLVLTREN
ncbi:MAG: carboxypeptidase-like regulatory domain-containing protein [bacterium]|nr:carboxypeptidase-like regulatory domain-containing protein [bacterium]